VTVSPVLALALLVAPPFVVEQGSYPEIEQLAGEDWIEVERILEREGVAPPASPRPVRVATSPALGPHTSAVSRPGTILLRPGLSWPGTGTAALRHEIAHQLLFEVCPAASVDHLFHEAFALSSSGEMPAWSTEEDGGYLPLAKALEILFRAPDLDRSDARRALVRLLAEAPTSAGHLPRAIARRLAHCDGATRWPRLRPEDLAEDGAQVADALVVLSRHSGQVLLAEGAASLPLPFGSTLKPFLLAGALREPPRLAPDPSRPGWRCGEDLPAAMDWSTALLRSCNGWFLEWASRDQKAIRMGAWGPALLAFGLTALPTDASEAIGIRPSLRISPVGLAQAYRLLAEARPDLLDLLSRNAREGTLAHLPASSALDGVAAKTGTVLDADANPRLGWIVAVDRDVVLVMVRSGQAPRSFASRLAATLERTREPARQAARVQVMGLVELAEVTATCQDHGFVAAHGGPIAVPGGAQRLIDLARSGPLVCCGGPWLVRYPGLAEPRPYAGIFTFEPAPPREPSAAGGRTPREERARRGSDLVFRTTRLLYAAGVVAAEDAAIRGEARVALARVADSNGLHSRHPGRPVCDTTHCQTFRGTPAPAREERLALASPLRADGWLPYSLGGATPWREERSSEAIAKILGPGARDLTFRGNRVGFVAVDEDGSDHWEERRELPCEVLRGPLKLPSCPERASVRGDRLIFEGRGSGHGEGLDIEWAKRSGLSAEEILARAYGREALRTGR
jgi:hypothetical protein